MITYIRDDNGVDHRRDTEEGTIDGEKTYCPVNGWDCPYYKTGVCHIDNPQDDCDDWGAFWDSLEDWLES